MVAGRSGDLPFLAVVVDGGTASRLEVAEATGGLLDAVVLEDATGCLGLAAGGMTVDV